MYEYTTFLVSSSTSLQQAIDGLEGDLFRLMFGAYARSKQPRLRRLCRLESQGARSEFLGLQYVTRLPSARTACSQDSLTADTSNTMAAIRQDLQMAENIPSLSGHTLRLRSQKPSELVKERCIKEWTNAEATITARYTPISAKSFDQPPVLTLRTPRHRFLAVTWYFLRLPRDPSGLKKARNGVGVATLATLHELLTKNRLSKTSLSQLCASIDRVLQMAPMPPPSRSNRRTAVTRS